MKSKKLKQIMAIATIATMVSTIAPVTAFAAWLKDSQDNWAFVEKGNKAKGWKQVEGVWYSFDANGKMQTGWLKDTDSQWYYLSSTGAMKTGWLKDTNGKWYYLASNGAMKTGWLKDTDGKWYFTDISGAMQTGVVEVQGKIYVLEASGAMATGSTIIGGVTYAIDASGAITGDKLPTPVKAFTNSGLATKTSVTSNSGASTTGNTDIGTTGSTSGSSSGGRSSHHSSNSSSSGIIKGQDVTCDKSGTYGPASGIVEVNNVSVNTPGVTLRNMHIKGDLVLGEGIGEGNVNLENVTVDGTTTITGGGEHSIYFINSILATVIVNKNDGRIRLVVEGRSQVANVQLESPARLEESGLTGGSTGFNDITVTDSVQTGTSLLVDLIGVFQNVSSRAENVRIRLEAGTDIQSLVLNEAAAILGTGRINTARINSNGTTITSRPENMIIHVGFLVRIQDESGNTTDTINNSYSNSTSAQITGMKLNMNSIKVNMSNFVSDLSVGDFNVSAKLGGQDYTLQNLQYDANAQRFTFDPVSLTDNVGKELEVTITPASAKVTGTAQADRITIKNGFSGRITDVQEVGFSGVTINFRAASTSNDGAIVATAVTDEDGYYTVYAPSGEYTGEISGTGVVTTYMIASSSERTFITGQDATAIRATGMNSVKIVLTWGERPRDEDSHLTGPTADGQGTFHTWYGGKIYKGADGIRYADLDWDDVTSYGPETTTIYKLVDGKYRFYVHNFSGEASLVGSGAKVQVYKGNSTTPINAFEIPNDTRNQNALYWFVFDMNVSENGETVTITSINELRYNENSVLRMANSAELSYFVNYGLLQGVPAGTIADLKADILTYDGGALKVVAAGTSIYDAASFDVATELSDSTAIENGQIVAVKAQDGTISTYTITLLGTDIIAPVISGVSDEDVTTSSAVTWTAPVPSVTDNVDTNLVAATEYSIDNELTWTASLGDAQDYLTTEGNQVQVKYTASDAAHNVAIPVVATFTAVADDEAGTTTPAGVTITLDASVGIVDDDTDTIIVSDVTTLEELEAGITTPSGVTFEACKGDGVTEATDLQDGYKIIVKEDGTIIKVYTIRKLV